MSARAAWRLESMGFPEVYRYHAGKADWAAMGLPIEGAEAAIPTTGSAAAKDAPTCTIEEQVGAVRERARGTGWDVCVVVNENAVVLGLLTRAALDAAPDTAVEQVMEPGPTTYRPNLFAEDALHYMHQQHIEFVLVTTSDGELTGVLRHEDAARALAKAGGQGGKRPTGRSPYRRRLAAVATRSLPIPFSLISFR
jgi:CBS domain-containing protein